MTILAQFKNQHVEIIDTFERSGRKLATVKAITGKPFVGGDKWPVFTEWATAPIDELVNVHQDPQPDPEPAAPNLLSMALAYQERASWYSGESINLINDQAGKPLAWLKEGGGAVRLCVRGVRQSLLVYLCGLYGWQPMPNLGEKYNQWAAVAQAERSK